MSNSEAALRNGLSHIPLWRPVGRIREVSKGVVQVTGLSEAALQGDRIEIRAEAGPCFGEVIGLTDQTLLVLADDGSEGLAIGDSVFVHGRPQISPSEAWIGRVIDPYGQALDGRPLAMGAQPRMLRARPPNAAKRRGLGVRLSTGLCVFNTLLPLVQGQRMGIFAGAGVGKSTLLSQLVQRVACDVVVVALIGERGREVRDFTEVVLGPEGMARCVVVAATSDQPAVARRCCAWTAMAVAEYFRDQGKNVLFLADSITRFAEAHREIALASGEEGSLGGYPPSLSHAIMSLAERAGPGEGEMGDITAIFSVLVAGSDHEGPVADILRGTLDGHVLLNRTIAERGRYPAIDLLRSVSRSLPSAATEAENKMIAATRRLLGAYDRVEMMIQAGLYEAGSDPLVDEALVVWPALDGFLAAQEPFGIPDSFRRLGRILGQAKT